MRLLLQFLEVPCSSARVKQNHFGVSSPTGNTAFHHLHTRQNIDMTNEVKQVLDKRHFLFEFPLILIFTILNEQKLSQHI